ncbi:MAG: hypothetical protein DI535_01350 [Citrobacter freundii]|nr:MAG: hypothetical protein DI535_01350 [Citrobacter freundii]
MYKFLLLLFLPAYSIAQPGAVTAIGKQVSLQRLKTNLYHIASETMEGRMFGSRGDTLVSEFVAACFKANDVLAPYQDHGYFQEVTAVRNRQITRLTIGEKTSVLYDDWSLYPAMRLDLKNVPVLAVKFASSDELLKEMHELDVSGKLLLLNGKIMLRLFDTDRIDSVEHTLQRKGCLGILWSGPSVSKQLQSMNEYARVDLYDNSFRKFREMTGFPEIAITRDRLNELLAKDNLTADDQSALPDDGHTYPFVLKQTVSVFCEFRKETVTAPNVIGVIPGTDTSLSCIVVTAHHDHDGVDGNKIYYGAVDNGSGTAVIMELATLMNKAAKKGLRPKRTIVLASVTGEERGLLGSSWYVDHPLIPLSKTHAVLNVDMLGRVDTFYSGRKPDSNYVYLVIKDSLNRGLRNSLYQANKQVKLKLDTYYEDPKFSARRVGGSDQYPFYLKGIPFVRLDCGFCIDYHKTTDTPDRINYPLLTRQTQLVFYTLWNMADK